MAARMQVEVDFKFSAAHALPLYDGPCRRMHGHNYKLRVSCAATLNPKTGIALDFGEVQKVVAREIMPACDHRVLNDFMENPTAENVIMWMWSKLAGPLPGLTELRLWEQDEFCLIYKGE